MARRKVSQISIDQIALEDTKTLIERRIMSSGILTGNLINKLSEEIVLYFAQREKNAAAKTEVDQG